jgi:hypothetical protein
MLKFSEGECGGGGVTIVTLDCAGVLPGGTAEETLNYPAWTRGQEAVETLRAELDPEDRHTLCPLVAGGVNVHKLYSVMHDTCHSDDGTSTAPKA